MSQAARNDQQALRIIDTLFKEGVAPDNITRLLNYHYAETYHCDKQPNEKSIIRRVPEGSNYSPSVEVWKQP